MNKYIYRSNELYHFGIRGQRWGKRRWQYEDGSLTPEGREHYGYGDGREPSRNPNTEVKNAKAQNASASRNDKVKKALKIGAIVAGTALAAYGAYKVADVINNRKAMEAGRKAYNDNVESRRELMDWFNSTAPDRERIKRESISGARARVSSDGKQVVSWTFDRDKDHEATYFLGEDAESAYNKAYNSVRWKRKRK